jgi:hypothetical protein
MKRITFESLAECRAQFSEPKPEPKPAKSISIRIGDQVTVHKVGNWINGISGTVQRIVGKDTVIFLSGGTKYLASSKWLKPSK